VSVSTGSDVYYDPYDVDLNADPYAVLDRFPHWEVDLTNAELSPTSTVRGWESMPAVLT
jgi:hypothetical protein